MFAWQPVIIEQRICLFEEQINDLDVPIKQAEAQGEHADDMATYYEEGRVNAELDLEVLSNDVTAARELSEMLRNIHPFEDVAADILRVTSQTGIRFSCGGLAAAVTQQRIAGNPVLQNWQINLDTRTTRTTTHLDYFTELLNTSEPYIQVLSLDMDDWARDRDAATEMEAFYDNVHSDLVRKQDSLRARLASLHLDLATALDRKDRPGFVSRATHQISRHGAG